MQSPPINTDQFGTFTGDVARRGTQHEAARAKARAALNLAPTARFAIASEGAFGPHPAIALISCGIEIVLILERETGKDVVGHDLTTKTNFAQRSIGSLEEAERFAAEVGFPEHGLVVFAKQGGPVIAKGLNQWERLRAAVFLTLGAHGTAWLETDMRAHLNPTRMVSIRRAAENLVTRLGSRCPICAFPGWVATRQPGRPCQWCGTPTTDIWSELFVCSECGNREERAIDAERRADPGFCPHCNP